MTENLVDVPLDRVNGIRAVDVDSFWDSFTACAAIPTFGGVVAGEDGLTPAVKDLQVIALQLDLLPDGLEDVIDPVSVRGKGVRH